MDSGGLFEVRQLPLPNITLAHLPQVTTPGLIYICVGGFVVAVRFQL
jgi:hypothetical protein